jgi:hypothetical protein
MLHVSLNYSTRLYLDAARSTLDLRSSPEQVADQVASLASSQYLDVWHSLKDPEGFLSLEANADTSRINVALDFAIARCLSGDVETGSDTLTEIASSTTIPALEQVRLSAQRLAASLDEHSGRFCT